MEDDFTVELISSKCYKMGCQEKNQLEDMENQNVTVKTKKVQLTNKMNTIDEGITELEDKIKGIPPGYKSRAKTTTTKKSNREELKDMDI